MALGDWKTTEGKQRAVWVQPGCNVADEFGLLSPADVIIIESGVALIEAIFLIDNVLRRWDVRIPIIVVPADVLVVRAVAAAWQSSYGSSDNDDTFGWAVDTVETELELGTNQLFLIVHAAILGKESNTQRFGYHITIFLRGERLLKPDVLGNLAKL